MARLFKLTDVQSFGNQEVMNRYFYYNPDSDVTSESVANVWAGFVLPNVLATQSNHLSHTHIAVEELVTGSDKHVLNLSGVSGGQGGDYLNPFMAYGFSLFPKSGNFRAGGKRYAGVTEDEISDGVPTASFQILLDLLAADLNNDLIVNTSLETVTPVLARWDGKQNLWTVTPVLQSAFVRMTTQNSRKPYKGGGSFSFASMNTPIAGDVNGIPTGLTLPTGTGKQAPSVTWSELTVLKE